MKIGILTYHFAINYGAVLQCYALQQTLLDIGFSDVEVINFNTYNWRLLLQNIPHKFNYDALHKAFLKFRYWHNADKAFSDFVKDNINCTLPVKEKDLPEFTKRYDVIIVGSDQIWSPRMRKITTYFLNWSPSFHGVRMAYAPCCMIKETNPTQVKTLKEALEKFNFLSARDHETQDFVFQLIEKKPLLVPDPTLLYDFAPLLNDKPVINGPYIFVYVLGADIPGGNNAAIKKLRDYIPGAKVYTVALHKTNPINTSWADVTIYDASPKDWLNMIKHSKLVFTDSFHGTIFSMKFHVPFLAYYSMPSRKTRFEDMITRFNIGNNVITHVNEIRTINNLTACVDKELLKEKEIGLNYLKQLISLPNN